VKPPSKGSPRGQAGKGSDSPGFHSLQRGLTGGRKLIGSDYMEDPELLSAYLDYYWPASRAQCLAALDRLAFLGSLRDGGEPSIFPQKVIDVGSGPGPMAAAFASRGTGSFSLLDRSGRSLVLARERIAAEKGAESARVATMVCDIGTPDPRAIPLWGEADCVSFGHSLNELWPDRDDRVLRRAALLEKYSGALRSGGFMLVVEPALLETSRDLLRVRNLLVERGWTVAAPCSGRAQNACPALEAGPTHTCHESLRWNPPERTARLAASLGLDREWLKMTWFALLPPRGKKAGESDSPGARAPEPGERTVYRVVSDPMLNKGGRVRRLLCGALGRFPLSAQSLRGGNEPLETGFAAFDVLARGDFISLDGQESRENGWGMAPGTELHRLFPRDN